MQVVFREASQGRLEDTASSLKKTSTKPTLPKEARTGFYVEAPKLVPKRRIYDLLVVTRLEFRIKNDMIVIGFSLPYYRQMK